MTAPEPEPATAASHSMICSTSCRSTELETHAPTSTTAPTPTLLMAALASRTSSTSCAASKVAAEQPRPRACGCSLLCIKDLAECPQFWYILPARQLAAQDPEGLSMARRSLKLLPLLIVAIGLTCVVSARAQDCDGWVALGEPSPRLGHAMVYDSARNVVVLFGGRLDPQTTSGAISAETWEFDGTRWRFRTGDGPLGRFDHAMAYDSDRHVTVLFGGNNIAV